MTKSMGSIFHYIIRNFKVSQMTGTTPQRRRHGHNTGQLFGSVAGKNANFRLHQVNLTVCKTSPICRGEGLTYLRRGLTMLHLRTLCISDRFGICDEADVTELNRILSNTEENENIA